MKVGPDACNWFPLVLSRTHEEPKWCGNVCVQHWDMRVGGQQVWMHRCKEHKVADEFISKLRQAEHR